MRKLRTGVAAFLAVPGLVGASLALGQTAAYAAPGGLDTSFGTGGKVVTSYSGPAPTDALLQPDGKIVLVVGLSNTPTATQSIALVRYQSNGAIDTTFGQAGWASTNFTNFINYANDAVLQPDGKIVVAGEAQSADGTVSEFAVARFTANGALDTTFGTGGKVTTNFVGVMLGGVSNPASTVLLQPDGKILVGGSASRCPRNCGARQTALARYNSNGSLDTTFGTGGEVSVVAIGQVSTLAEDSAGNIFALDNAQVAEFSQSGSLLPQVTPAPVVVSSGGGFQTQPALFQADGRYIVSSGLADGTSGYLHDVDVKVTRYQPNGLVDPTFTSPAFDFAGEAPNATDLAQGIAQQPNGQVVLAGLTSANGVATFSIARLATSGALDTAFGTGGIVTVAANAQGSVVRIQPDGKILAVGQGFTNGATTIVLARYLGQ